MKNWLVHYGVVACTFVASLASAAESSAPAKPSVVNFPGIADGSVTSLWTSGTDN